MQLWYFIYIIFALLPDIDINEDAKKYTRAGLETQDHHNTNSGDEFIS